MFIVGCQTTQVKTERTLNKLTEKVYVEYHNADTRSYHLDMGINYPLGGNQILIYDIVGVQIVHSAPYQFVVTKSPLFKWDKIEAEILKILRD